ncbi:hypothetical protein HT031_005244 [Scenedesmus sp. PABB004]|nr:hypothetical protein HT031_005244 [Scenedesmus sp. PABB004]
MPRRRSASTLGLALAAAALWAAAAAPPGAPRRLAQAGPAAAMNPPVGGGGGANATRRFSSLAAAIAAANETSGMATLLAALDAAGLTSSTSALLNSSDCAWTILAPTDAAFASRLSEDLGATPAALLANRTLLLQARALACVLSYHVIRSAALTSAQLTDGMTLTTALAGAAPLVVQARPRARAPGRATRAPRGADSPVRACGAPIAAVTLAQIKTKHSDGSRRATPSLKFIGATNKARAVGPDVVAGASVVHVVDDLLLPTGVGVKGGKHGGGGSGGGAAGDGYDTAADGAAANA